MRILTLLILLSFPCFAEHIEVPKQKWSFNGPFGTFKKDALQRGFQVYKEVCSTCHSMKHLAYRNLNALGFNEAEIKAIAAEHEITNAQPNLDGQMFKRKALPSDTFVSPYDNDNAARESGVQIIFMLCWWGIKALRMASALTLVGIIISIFQAIKFRWLLR